MANDDTRQEVLTILVRIPLLREVPAGDIAIARLGGLTNKNYRLETPLGRFVLRIPGAGTGEYIDRRNEAHAARIAAAAGVNAEILFFDEGDGVMLCRFLDGAVTMDGERFKDLSAIARAARSLRRVHECGQAFRNRFALFRMIEDYLAILEKKGAKLPNGYRAAQIEAEKVKQALERRPPPLRPCHCDPLAENFLDTGARIHIIDWEYAGNNDPMWDLGDLSVEAGFTPEQDEALLAAYFAASIPKAERGRMVLYKAMCDLLWTLWGVIQHVNGNPAEDFWAYATNRFARCARLMGSEDFGRHLQAAGGR